MRCLLLVALLPLVFAQWRGGAGDRGRNDGRGGAGRVAAAGDRGPGTPSAANPEPGHYLHHSLHPVSPMHGLWQPVGREEERLRRIEIKLGLIDPECTGPHAGPRTDMTRVEYGSDPNYIYQTTDPDLMSVAARAGYTGPTVVMGRLATEKYNRGCECLIPLYRRTYDKSTYRVDYQTEMTYKDVNSMESGYRRGEWGIEGYCVPYRGACGANLQLSRMTPVDTEGDDRPVTLVTSDDDRVLWGYDKGWDEVTLCYVWDN